MDQGGRRLEGGRPERRSERADAQVRTLTRDDAVVPLAVLAVICSPPRESWWSLAAGVYLEAPGHAMVSLVYVSRIARG